MQADIEKDVLAIDLRNVPFIDSSASAALDEVIQRLGEMGDTVLLFGARPQVIETLRKADVLPRLGEQNLHARRIDALRSARSILGFVAAQLLIRSIVGSYMGFSEARALMRSPATSTSQLPVFTMSAVKGSSRQAKPIPTAPPSV